MTLGRGYRRVQSEEGVSSSGEQQQRGRTRSERITEKLYALGWVSVAILVARWTNFYHVIVSSDQVNRIVLHLAAACLGINIVLLLYLTVYLPRVIKLKDSSAWQVYCPNVVPSMCGFAFLCAVFLIRATYPVWGFFAPLLLGIEAMGALFASQLIPWF